MIVRSAGLISAVLLAYAKPVAAADYLIDTQGGHAAINFRIKHLGFSWLTGRFDTFSGTFSYDEKNPAASCVSVTIATASINSNHAERDKHLRNADYLDVAAYPQATFVSKSVTPGASGKAVITGEFTLRGITKEVAIEAEPLGGGADPWGGFRTGFTGKTSFRLADFGIVKELGPASKTVELELHVEGVRK